MEQVLTPVVAPTVEIESLDLEARGVAHLPPENETSSGKVVFVEGALPGERVVFESFRRKSTYEIARAVAIVRASSTRVQPCCKHFGICGGCSMQHLDPAAQIAIKQRALEDGLWHLAKLRPEIVLRPIQGPDWGYRYRARLSVRHVPKKGGVLVGFHERRSSYVADIRECHVLPAHISDMLVPLRELVAALTVRDRLPQIEYAQGDDATVLVLRILDPLSQGDVERLMTFAARYQVEIWLQPKGPDSVARLDGLPSTGLTYSLPEFGITMPFLPTDFTQVNHRINRVLVSQAIGLLDPQRHERVLDLFCGLGNFTLPLARRCAQVHGIEGSATLVQRAQSNAQANGIDNATFSARNLFEVTSDEVRSWGSIDKLLIDPPREGALEVARAISGLEKKPQRIVYVSCNPATLARDAAILVHEGGYALRAAGVVNMFPHTSHVESIGVFEPVAEIPHSVALA